MHYFSLMKWLEIAVELRAFISAPIQYRLPVISITLLLMESLCTFNCLCFIWIHRVFILNLLSDSLFQFSFISMPFFKNVFFLFLLQNVGKHHWNKRCAKIKWSTRIRQWRYHCKWNCELFAESRNQNSIPTLLFHHTCGYFL